MERRGSDGLPYPRFASGRGADLNEPSFLDHALPLLRNMALARAGDLRESVLVRQGRGSFQASATGHEGLAAFAALVEEGDLVFPTYRGRALLHALGMTAEEAARDFLVREGSSSGGRNLPGHYSSRRLGVFSVTSPVGAQCLPAVGAAWAFRLDGSRSVALCLIGDAATRQGEFLEAVAQAVQEALPIVFVVEDNGYGISTPTAGTTALALGMLPPAIVERVDGRNAEGVFDAGRAAMARARDGGGPTILWCDIDRIANHTSADDQRAYRTPASIAAMDHGDPVARLADSLIRSGAMDDAGWDAMRRETEDEIRRAYETVAKEEGPAPEGVAHHLYGAGDAELPPNRAPRAATMLQAVNGTLRAGLAGNPRIVVFGEDVEDPKGGVFGITKGLSEDFSGRVVNSPLAEATIVGAAVGLAAVGWRPVFELQFIDFVGPAFNQIVSQVTNLRWRTKGDWTCPLVIYAPYGAYLPGGGMWHSQSNEGLFAGLTGLRVAVPSTPDDAAGLLWAAMHGDDPSLVLLPKHLLRAEATPAAGESLAWGRGRVVRRGDDATVVAWGNLVEIAQAAAELMAAEGVELEIVDPRTLVPCDWDLIVGSVDRTGRLVVTQEDSKTCGFGQAIVAEVTARAFGSLRAAPILVSRADVPVPYAPILEAAILPSVDDVVRAVRSTLATVAREAADAGMAARDEGLVTLTVPQLGEGLRRVRVTAHLKVPGDFVALDEPLYEIETDKANVAVESPNAGILVEWCVEVGEEADVHGPIARLGVDAPSMAPPLANAPSPTTFEEFPVSERQRAMNRMRAVGGRLDVPIPASVGRPLPWRLVEEARARLRTINPRLRLTEFGVFACAAARATQGHPKFRSSLVSRGETVRRYAHVDMGFAIALPGDELTTAVVKDADSLTFEAFGQELRARHREAKAGVSQSDARTTLLISSLAGHDVTDAAPVLFPPAVATLFLGSPFPGTTGREANMRLAFDHRLINGVGAASYLQAIEAELAGFGQSPEPGEPWEPVALPMGSSTR